LHAEVLPHQAHLQALVTVMTIITDKAPVLEREQVLGRAQEQVQEQVRRQDLLLLRNLHREPLLEQDLTISQRGNLAEHQPSPLKHLFGLKTEPLISGFEQTCHPSNFLQTSPLIKR
jgi:hypothetical protein